MKLLLDTHVFLWWRTDDKRLGPAARSAIADPANGVYVSAAVAWEIVIKRSLGRLAFEGSVAAALAEEGFEALPVSVAHADGAAGLPDLHRDPFDRIQLAQAQLEGATLVTHDAAILAYPSISLMAV